MIYAVIDTNVLVSAFITHNAQAATVAVVESIMDGRLIPVYNDEILAEYNEVLHRPKFKLNDEDISLQIAAIQMLGIPASRVPYDGDMIDEKDRVFYEVSLAEDESFLVTGNLKHFPRTPRVVTPAEMMEILRALD